MRPAAVNQTYKIHSIKGSWHMNVGEHGTNLASDLLEKLERGIGIASV